MKKLNRITAAMAALIISVAPTAFAACDSRGTEDSAGVGAYLPGRDFGGAEIPGFDDCPADIPQQSCPSAPEIQPPADDGESGDSRQDTENSQNTNNSQNTENNRPANQNDGNGGQVRTASYVKVTGEGVNIRSGAGGTFSVRGKAEKDTLYGVSDKCGNWYEVDYLGKTGYIYSDYCAPLEMNLSNLPVESVISAGERLLGTPYVYGAARLHDGKGNLIKNFTKSEFDCSSLMQYIFYEGAGVLLNVTTRTQVLQGRPIERQDVARGDLMFFTNASRKNNSGTERIGHVAMYLGDGYILHTASDYAKIEKISPLRESYFICARRIIG